MMLVIGRDFSISLANRRPRDGRRHRPGGEPRLPSALAQTEPSVRGKHDCCPLRRVVAPSPVTVTHTTSIPKATSLRRITAAPVFNDDGEVTHIVESCATSPIAGGGNRLEQDHNLLRALIDNLPDCIYVKDKQAVPGRESRHRAAHGRPDRTILGKSDADFYPRSRCRVSHERKSCSVGPTAAQQERVSLRLRRQLRTVVTTKIPLLDGQARSTAS